MVNPIQLSSTDDLTSLFYSKKKTGLNLSVKELLDVKKLSLFGSFMERTRLYADLVKNLLIAVTKDSDLEYLKNLKVPIIPPDLESALKTSVPTIEGVKNPSAESTLLYQMNKVLRLSLNDMVIEASEFVKLGLKSELTESSKAQPRSRLLELVQSKEWKDNGQDIKLALSNIKELISRYGSYKELVQCIENWKLIRGKPKIPNIENQFKEKSDEQVLKKLKVSEKFKVFILRKKEKKKRTYPIGYARNPLARKVLERIRNSKLFSSMEVGLSNYLYSFSSPLLQGIAANIIFAEMLRLKPFVEEEGFKNFDTSRIVKEEVPPDEEVENELEEL